MASLLTGISPLRYASSRGTSFSLRNCRRSILLGAHSDHRPQNLAKKKQIPRKLPTQRSQPGTKISYSTFVPRASSTSGETQTSTGNSNGVGMTEVEVDSSEEYLIQRPLEGRTGSEALLIFLPGALTPPTAYTDLLNAIQDASDLRLWVATIIFTNDVASEAEIRDRYQSARKALRVQGFPGEESSSSNVFFAGHSLGAFVGRVPALHLAQAFIQMGSWFNPKDDSLAQYPKPVLSLSGELDGQIPMHAFAIGAGAVAKLELKLGAQFLAAEKPTVVIKGMNHCQFSHGRPNRERGDWDPEISIEEARRRVGVAVGAWLQVQVEGRAGEGWEKAWGVLSGEVEESKAVLGPYWEAIDAEGEGWEGTQRWLLEHLKGKAGGDVRPFRSEILWHDFRDNFMYSKPFIDTEQELVVNQAFLQRRGKYMLSSSLWLKMKSVDAIRHVFGTTLEGGGEGEGGKGGGGEGEGEREGEGEGEGEGDMEGGGEGGGFLDGGLVMGKQCNVARTLNAHVFDLALGKCHPSVRSRYERSGKKVRFVADKVEMSGAKWIESEVEFVVASDGSDMMDVQSTTLVTPLEGVPVRFAGMHYVKVLTVALAMEYIMVDAFR